MRKQWALIIFIVLSAVLGPAQAVAGNGVDRGGGDAYEQELRTLGHAIAAKLRALRTESASHALGAIAPELLTLDLTAFEEAVDSTRVISTDDPVLVLIEGKWVPRECANSKQEKLIWVNRPMWNEHLGDRISKESIALHEYLGVMSVDRAYELSLSYRRRLELEADTTDFKIALTENLKDLGAALQDHFKTRFDPVFARLETIASTEEYRLCIETKKKSKPERLARCFGVTAMILKAERLTPVAADSNWLAAARSDDANIFDFELVKASYHCGWKRPRALFNWLFDKYRKWQIVCPKVDEIIAVYKMPRKVEEAPLRKRTDEKFLAFVNALASTSRREFAMKARNRLIDEFNASAGEIHNRLQSFNGDANRACPGDLTDAIRCAVPRVLNSVEQTLEPAMNEKHKHLGQSVVELAQEVAKYTE